MPQPIRPDDRFRSAPDVLCRELDDEAVLLDVASGRYFSLNRTGARIWALMVGGRRFEEIVTALAGEFAASADQLRADAEELLGELESEGLVRRGD